MKAYLNDLESRKFSAKKGHSVSVMNKSNTLESIGNMSKQSSPNGRKRNITFASSPVRNFNHLVESTHELDCPRSINSRVLSQEKSPSRLERRPSLKGKIEIRSNNHIPTEQCCARAVGADNLNIIKIYHGVDGQPVTTEAQRNRLNRSLSQEQSPHTGLNTPLNAIMQQIRMLRCENQDLRSLIGWHKQTSPVKRQNHSSRKSSASKILFHSSSRKNNT
jgi:hypothetical protein